MRAWSRGLPAFGLLAVLSACGDAPLVKLTLHYSGFEPACVQVQASDAADPDLPAPQPVPVPPGTRSGELAVVIWGKPGWGNQVRLETEAHELTCEGPKVAGEVRMVTVTHGQTFPLELFLEATDADQDGFVAAPAGTDCDDAQASVHPGGTELCNNQDDNCANGVDEGFNVGGSCGADGGCGTVQCEQDGGTFCANGSAFYRDDDGDGFGRTDDVLYRCTAPSGYTLSPGDCQDDAGFVHPGAPEICDGLDDNCVSGIDEGLGLGAGCAAPYGCPGQNVCAPGGGVMCMATGGGVIAGKHPDEDEDGHGAPVEVCTLDAGVPLVSSSDDCDDGDPFTAPGFPEICDRRDNDCDGQVDKNDAGALACPTPAGWVAHQAGGGTFSWRSIWSWTDGGVWATGAAQKLRVHAPGDSYAAGSAWTNYDGNCNNGTYTGIWADPASGQAFAVSPSGLFCEHDLGSSVQKQDALVSPNLSDPVSVVGFRTGSLVELYVAGADGGTLRWFPDAGSQPLDPISGVHLNDIHGSSRDVIFAAGQAPGTPADPRLYRFSQPSSWIQTPLPAPLPGSGASVAAVYSVGPRLAFAVTDTAAVLEWDGGTWGMHSSPPDAGALRGVLAFGKHSLFVIDAKTAWEWNGNAWTKLLDAGTTGTLVDLHGTNPADIWVAQDPQMIYRWPQ